MLRAYSGSYPSVIHSIRDACQKYCDENKIDGLTELHEVDNLLLLKNRCYSIIVQERIR